MKFRIPSVIMALFFLLGELASQQNFHAVSLNIHGDIPNQIFQFQNVQYLCSKGGVWRFNQSNSAWEQFNQGISGESGLLNAATKSFFVWNNKLNILKEDGQIMQLKDGRWTQILHGKNFDAVYPVNSKLYGFVGSSTNFETGDLRYDLKVFESGSAEGENINISYFESQAMEAPFATYEGNKILVSDGNNLHIVEGNTKTFFSYYEGHKGVYTLSKDDIWVWNNDADWYNKQSHLLKYTNGFWEAYNFVSGTYNDVFHVTKTNEGISVSLLEIGFGYAYDYRGYRAYSIEYDYQDTLLNPNNKRIQNYLVMDRSSLDRVGLGGIKVGSNYWLAMNGGAVMVNDYHFLVPQPLTDIYYKDGFHGLELISAQSRANRLVGLKKDYLKPDRNYLYSLSNSSSSFKYSEENVETIRYFENFEIYFHGWYDHFTLIDQYENHRELREFWLDPDFDPKESFFSTTSDLAVYQPRPERGLYYDELNYLHVINEYGFQSSYLMPGDTGKALAIKGNPKELWLLSEIRKDQEGKFSPSSQNFLWVRQDNSAWKKVDFNDQAPSGYSRHVISFNPWKNDSYIATVREYLTNSPSSGRFLYYIYNRNTRQLSFKSDSQGPEEFIKFGQGYMGIKDGKAWYSSDDNLSWEMISFNGIPEGAEIASIVPSDNGSYIIATKGNGVYRSNGLTSGINEFTGSEMLNVYPNPASSTLQFHLTNPIQKAQIFDNQGRVIEADLKPLNALEYQLNVSQLGNGIYHLKVLDVNGISSTAKVSVVH
ncbi:MAG: T9SS type A sorting domain-containing protein [Luteibaculum sp.]